MERGPRPSSPAGLVADDVGERSDGSAGGASPGEAPTGRKERRSRWFKTGRRVVAGILLAGGIYAVWSHRQQMHTALDRLGHPAWPWLVLAVWAEMSSMVIFARLQRWLLRAGGVSVRLRDMVEITLAGNALSVSIPGGAAWSAGWIWGQLRRRRVDRVLAAWVVLVAGALASYALFLLVVAGAEIAGNRGPVASLRWVERILLALGVLLVAGLFALGRSPWLQDRWRRFQCSWSAAGGRRRQVADALATFGERLRVVQPTPLAWVEALGLALGNWVADLASLIFCIKTVHASVPWSGVVISYALTQISASLPITPGGLAVVEASMTALLTAYGLPASTAITVVLLYRLISF
ncbi:MAG TPA: YbhN family protein, partial [Acidimicrobiales bacterium]|nr:YbhN family protein [Acidimicrobiales bacterium]